MTLQDGNDLHKGKEMQRAKIIPEYTLEIVPSHKLQYPEDIVIKYRPYLYGEVKKFNSGTMSFEETLMFALEGISVSSEKNPAFTKEQLTVADVIYISLHRKLVSLGSSSFTCNYVCANCGENSSFVLQSDKLEFDEIRVPKFPIRATFSDVEFHFEGLTVKDYVDNKLEKEVSGDTISYLAAMCTNISYETAKTILSNATIEEGFVLEELDTLLYHGLKEVVTECEKCNTMNKVQVEGGDVVIGPFRGPGESVRSRIQFGL